jgi:hypothetical protein
MIRYRDFKFEILSYALTAAVLPWLVSGSDTGQLAVVTRSDSV